MDKKTHEKQILQNFFEQNFQALFEVIMESDAVSDPRSVLREPLVEDLKHD